CPAAHDVLRGLVAAMTPADFAFVVGLQLLVLVPIVDRRQHHRYGFFAPRHRNPVKDDRDCRGLLTALCTTDRGDSTSKLSPSLKHELSVDRYRFVQNCADLIAYFAEF